MPSILENKINHAGLSAAEKNILLHHLTRQQAARAEKEKQAASIKKMRGKILHTAYEMRWTKILPGHAKPVVDYNKLENWMQNFSYLHKKLDRYTFKELPKLVSQFEAVYKHFLNNI